MTPPVALGYARRSKESDARTVSLADQRERITAYSATLSVPLVDILTDDGISGGKRERFGRIKAALRQHGATVLVAYHHDRLARDAEGFLGFLAWAQRRHVAVHVVGRGPIETATASGFLTNGVEAMVAEHYRRAIGEKTRDALAHLRTQGRRISRFAPYGWRFAGAAVEPEPTEQAALTAARAHPALALRPLAALLSQQGYHDRAGHPFSPGSLARMRARG